MKKISAILFWAVLGVIFVAGLGYNPLFGLLLSGVAFIPGPSGAMCENPLGNPAPELSPEEKALLEKIENKVKSLTHNLTAGLISETLFNQKMDDLKNEIKAIKESNTVADLNAKIKAIEDAAKEQGIEISKIKQMGGGQPEKRKTLLEGVKEFLANESIKSYIENGAKGASIQIKVAVNMGMSNAISGHTTQPQQMLGGIPVYTPERKISMVDLLNTGTSSTETITFNEEYNFVDGVSTLSENQATGQTSFMVREKTLSAGRIGTHLIVSKRMLKNEKYLASHIATRIPQKIRKQEDYQILFGPGTGTDLTGLTTNASAFAAGSFAGAVPHAQEYDVLMVAISQLTQGEYQASGIVLNPVDATKIEMLKDTTGKYLAIMRGADGVLRVGGVPVVETTAMTAGRFLVGDLKMACEWLLFTTLTMSMSDSHGTIFLNNQVCINFEEEPIFPIYNPLMFVYGTFSTAIAAIDQAS